MSLLLCRIWLGWKDVQLEITLDCLYKNVKHFYARWRSLNLLNSCIKVSGPKVQQLG